MKVPYQNTSDHVRHIGSVTLMPGQTRDVEEIDLHAHIGGEQPEAQKAEPAIDNALSVILSGSVKDIIGALAEVSDTDLNSMEDMEKAAEKPRKGVLSAVAEERLNRASNKQATEMQLFIESLPGMSDEELAEMLGLYSGDEANAAYLAAIVTEQDNRAGDQ